MLKLMRRIGSERGFTLIEMLGVGAIIAILAAVAVPTILGAMNKSKVNVATDSLSQMAGALQRYYAGQVDVNNNGQFPVSQAPGVSTESAWTALANSWATGYWNSPATPNYSFQSYMTDATGTQFALCVKANDSSTTVLKIDEHGTITKGATASQCSTLS